MICAVVDSRISDTCRSRLIAEGFYVIPLPPHKALSAPVASHTDMLIARIGDNLILNREYAEEYREIVADIQAHASGYGITLDDAKLQAEYPSDCVYNCLSANGKIYTAHTDNPSLIRIAGDTGKTPVKIKQGYPACTTLLLSDNIAITADRGMARVLENDGITSLLIENGDIALPPYEYGFIGGACGVCGNTVYFLGNVAKHRDYAKITEAIARANMKYVCLSDEGLVDLGGILFL